MTRIAIVEDNRVIRESIIELLRPEADFECVCDCSSGEEALKRVPEHRPDVVLMDVHLPKMSGIECTAQLKELLPKVQIIMVTVHEDTHRIFNALRAGASGYLIKRYVPQELVEALRQIREGGAPMSPIIARKVIASFQEPLTVAAEVEELSPREKEILELLASGLTNKEIAAHLGLTAGTVRWYLGFVYEKLHVRSRTEAALKFRPAQG